MRVRVEYTIDTGALKRHLAVEVKYSDPALARQYALETLEELKDTIKPKDA